MLASGPQRRRKIYSKYNLSSIRASIKNLLHTNTLLTWRVGHGHQEVVAGGGGAQPGGGAGPRGGSVEGRGAGGGAVEGGAGRGDAITETAQAGAQTQHQAGRAASLKYRGSVK